MIICMCYNVTEQEIKKLLPCSVEDIMMKTEAGMACGSCFHALQETVDFQATELDRLSSICFPIQTA